MTLVPRPGSLRRSARVVLGLVRIDARRPASWLVAAATMAVVAITPPSRGWAAAGGGALLALAAVGALLRASPAADLLSARLVARLAWPLVAITIGASVAGLNGGDAPGRTRVAVATACGVILAAVAFGCAKWLPRPRGVEEPVVHHPFGPGQALLVGRSWADVAAMASTVVAMAACYFLAPEFSAWYTVVATAWFTALAVPAATLVGGDERSRRDLLASVPGRPRVGGTPTAAMSILASYAAVLGWPAAVAAIVAREHPWGWRHPLAAMLVLAVAAALASGLAWASWVRRWREDTALVVVAVAHAAAFALAARIA